MFKKTRSRRSFHHVCCVSPVGYLLSFLFVEPDLGFVVPCLPAFGVQYLREGKESKKERKRERERERRTEPVFAVARTNCVLLFRLLADVLCKMKKKKKKKNLFLLLSSPPVLGPQKEVCYFCFSFQLLLLVLLLLLLLLLFDPCHVAQGRFTVD